MIQRTRSILTAERSANRFVPNDNFKPHPPHRAGNGAASNIEAFPLHLPPDLAHAINPEVEASGKPGAVQLAGKFTAIDGFLGAFQRGA